MGCQRPWAGLLVAAVLTVAALAALGAGPAAAAPACTTTWLGGDGLWSADHWSAGVPDAEATACIDGGIVTHAAGLSGVRFVVVGDGAALRVTGGRLDVGRAADVPETSALGDASVAGGTLVVSGSARGGTMEVTAGALDVAGALRATEVQASGGSLRVGGQLEATVQLLASVPLALTGRLDGTLFVAPGVSQSVAGTGTLAAAAAVDGALELAGTLQLALDEARLGDGASLVGASVPAEPVAVAKRAGPGIATYALPGRLGTVTAEGGELRLGLAHGRADFVGGIVLSGGAVLRLADELAFTDVGGLMLTDGARVLTAAGGNPFGRLQTVGTLWLREAQLTTARALGIASYAVMEHGARVDATLGVDVQAGARLEVHLGPARIGGALRLAPDATLIALVEDPPTAAVLDVGGAVQLAGRLQLVHTDGRPAALGQTYALVSSTSSSGAFGAVEDVVPLGAGWPLLVPEYGPTLLRVRADPVAPPRVEDAAVDSVTATTAVISAMVSAGGADGSSWLTLTGPSGDLQGSAVPLDAGTVYDVRWGIVGLQPETTYVARIAASTVAGTALSPALTFTTPGMPSGGTGGPGGAPPTSPPVVTPTRTPLEPVRAPGPRILDLVRAGPAAFRVAVPYRLQRTCATRCRATVELLLRTGKVLYAAGDGKRLARGTVILRRGANTVRLRVPRAALRGLRWTRAGRYETLRVRLRVALPQPDGRRQLTIRDGLLRRPG